MVVKGFPVGGNSLSTTQGIVSRIEYAYYDAGAAGLRIQVDAAISAGNSGSPAVVDGKMVGLVYGVGPGENIGYVIPIEEIDGFLADVADGRYDGKPRLFEQFQILDNERFGPGSGWRRPSAGS